MLQTFSVQIITEFCNAANWCPIYLYKSGLFFVIERVVCFFLFVFDNVLCRKSFYAELCFTICLLICQGF